MSVAHLDLRGCDAHEALVRVEKTLRTDRDVRLLLVSDSVREVGSHRAAFEAIDGSHRIGRLLCLVIGRPDVPHVRLPGNIERRTLWVLDEQGVDWPLLAAAPVIPHDGDGLAKLTAILRADDVFKGTCAELAKVPYGAAVPGLRLADLSGMGQAEFVQALLAAVKRLLEPLGATPKELGPATPTGVAPARLTPAGPLAKSLTRTDETVTEARELAGELAGPRALLRRLPVREAFQDAGAALAATRATMLDLLAAMPHGTRITDDGLAAVTAFGMAPPPLATFEPAAGARHLGRWVAGSLRGGSSLARMGNALQERIRVLEQDRVSPKAVDDLCPASLLPRLTDPDPFPLPQRTLPVAGLVCAALSGLTPLGIGGGLVMAALWTMLVALTIIRGPGGTLHQEAQRALGGNGVAAVVGAIGGGLAGTAGLPGVAWGLAVLGGLAGALAAILASWSARAALWVMRNEVAEAQRAADGFPQLVTRAVTDWAANNARLDEARALNRLRQALAGARDSLKDFADHNERDLHGAQARPSEAFREKINHWSQDLVAEAVKPALSGRDLGKANEIRSYTKATTTTLISDWEKRGESDRVAEPPEYATAFEPTVQGTEAEDLQRLAHEVSRDPAEEMWQLCGADDLGLLDTATPPGTVRFVPAGASFDVPLPPDTVRDSAGSCGVVRLVALRPRVVEWMWHDKDREDEADEADGGGL